jgi:hypothetical protein
LKRILVALRPTPHLGLFTVIVTSRRCRLSSASADTPRAQERLSEKQNIDRVGIDRRGLVGEGVHALLTPI